MITKITYDYADRILIALVKSIRRRFKRLRTIQIDELNIIPISVSELYDDLEELNRKAFENIAKHYYGTGFDMWLEKFLDTPNETIKYAYTTETLRKRARLEEALIAVERQHTQTAAHIKQGTPTQEIERAMKAWVQMSGWFAVEVTDEAVKTLWKQNSVKRVRWRIADEPNVCGICIGLDGQIFALDKVPPKPHPNCRCYLEVVI